MAWDTCNSPARPTTRHGTACFFRCRPGRAEANSRELLIERALAGSLYSSAQNDVLACRMYH